ncbi:MAG: benzoyl-CoA 2,3-epoxidase subunit BoxB [Alphaproteobacteria bacterium]|nr:benzoyl-CoA 2,3-epoxidase subunit BoxB [Alphaproteobacteria bacterium]MCB9690339.1 benzoyl-CoA 2,3-epoxidase subunit BoxB [Alphaproteobacteria bacterium]
MGIDYSERIPNNVDLSSDRRLQRALEKWQPAFLDWWMDMGPEGWQAKDVYLRTAVSVDKGGWANFGYVQMPEYRWGIFLTEREEGRKVGFGDHADEEAWQTVPGEYRNMLQRIIVTQADTEPASVEQQRYLGATAPSLYDLRNLFQVNVEEGRHLWAMVYLLHGYFGRDGREEAEELLARRAGDEDKPRILDAFNQQCPDWLTFFCFTTFTDRDGKYQLGALAESGFDPLARTCRFMLTEEAHHLFVGQTGVERILRRGVELAKEAPSGDARDLGGIRPATVQKYVNYWYTYSLDLFGSEISSNAADFFASGLKGRWQEMRRYEDHVALEAHVPMQVYEDGRLVEKLVPMRNAMNELLRSEYVRDCESVVEKWNKALEQEGTDFRITLPSTRFHRRQGIYAGSHFDPAGNPVTEEQFEANRAAWLPTDEERAYVASLMSACYEPGKMANWIAPPRRGIDGQTVEFEYVRV